MEESVKGLIPSSNAMSSDKFRSIQQKEVSPNYVGTFSNKPEETKDGNNPVLPDL